MPEKISRGEFLKLLGAVLAGKSLSPMIQKIESAGIGIREKEPDPLNHVVNLPCLEYHDPEFNAGKDACMTKEVFEAQLEFLKATGYHTPNAEEVSGFLRGKTLLPYHSVVLRFDLGTDKIDHTTGRSFWYGVLQTLEEKGLHGIIFLIPQAAESLRNGIDWKTIANYVNKGVISICSHGLPDHQNYRNIKADYALYSMKTSREILLRRLKEAGVKNPQVLGFAFPFDAVPDNAQELTKKAGYEFYAGGTKKNGSNFATFGSNEELPAIYPYVYRSELEEVKNNKQPNLALLKIKGGLSFLDTLLENGNIIVVDESWKKYAIELGKPLFLNPTDISTGQIIKPVCIIVHTDSQNPSSPESWRAEHTFQGINGGRRKIAVNFGVDSLKTIQFTPIFQRKGSLWIIKPRPESQAAQGSGASINVEMAGYRFDEILKNGNKNEKEIVINTLENTALLILQLRKMNNRKMPVFGHFEMTVRGKSDPGEVAMQILREMINEKNKIPTKLPNKIE